MRFFHVYNEQYFEGLVKNNLLNQDSGFKLQHCFAVPTAQKFNEYAKVGSKLYNLIRENKYPFYVDRIAGGITYYKYDFDKALIREYREMLGSWFLGFQLHESASNRLGADWGRIREATGSNGPYDVEELKRLLIRDYAVTPEGKTLYRITQGSPEEYAKLQYQETIEGYLDEIREMFRWRMEETDGHILPCDSFFMCTKIQDEIGMETFMPEVGAQIGMMRLEVALARGMARAKNKTWGTYYECWRNTPGVGPTMPVYHVDEVNEWYLTQETHKDNFTGYGENGGSSRLLQNRVYYHSLMSGADYMGEEWGLNCSYYDMNDFTLSPYGEVKKRFIHKAETLRGVQAVTPFAIVLPKEMPCICLSEMGLKYPLGVENAQYMWKDLTPEQIPLYDHTRNILKLFFSRYEASIGNEGHTLTNSRLGDIADVIYEDAPEAALDRYAYLVDASFNGNFAKTRGQGRKVISCDGDWDALENTVKKLLPDLLPCYVDGLDWLVSTDEKGNRYVSIFNHEGNERSIEKGDTLLKEADKTVTLTFREKTEIEVVVEGYCPVDIQRKDDKTYLVHVPAADFVIFRF